MRLSRYGEGEPSRPDTAHQDGAMRNKLIKDGPPIEVQSK